MNSHCIHIGMADSDVKSATFSSVPELKKIISTDKAPAAIGPYSQATVVGKTAYVSGCIAIIPGSSPPTLAEGGIEGQTRQLLDNMKAVVEACGGTMASVCKTTIFLHGDMSNCALRVSSNTQAAKCSVVSRPSFVRAATLCQFPS
jgi:enamine deaminase RidA (YjgF/YER057c/UK114 family)